MAQTLDLLFKTLDELGSANLKQFTTHLSQSTLEGFEPIPEQQLEDATDVGFMMKETYGDKGSVKMTLSILRKMNLNYLAENLEK